MSLESILKSIMIYSYERTPYSLLFYKEIYLKNYKTLTKEIKDTE